MGVPVKNALAEITLQGFKEWLQGTGEDVRRSDLPCWVLRRTAVAVVKSCKISPEGEACDTEKTDSNHMGPNLEIEASCLKAHKEQEEGHGKKGHANGGPAPVAHPAGKKGEKKGKAKVEDMQGLVDARTSQGEEEWICALDGFDRSQLVKFDRNQMTLTKVREVIQMCVMSWEKESGCETYSILLPVWEAEVLHYVVDLLVCMLRLADYHDSSNVDWSKEPQTYLLPVVCFLVNAFYPSAKSRAYVTEFAGLSLVQLLVELLPVMGSPPDDTDPADVAQRLALRSCTALLHYIVESRRLPPPEIQTMASSGLGSNFLVELAARHSKHEGGTPVEVMYLTGVLMFLMLKAFGLCGEDEKGSPNHRVWTDVSALCGCLPQLLTSLEHDKLTNPADGDDWSFSVLHVVKSLLFLEGLPPTSCKRCSRAVEHCRKEMRELKPRLLYLTSVATLNHLRAPIVETTFPSSLTPFAKLNRPPAPHVYTAFPYINVGLEDWSSTLMKFLQGLTAADFGPDGELKPLGRDKPVPKAVAADGPAKWKALDCCTSLLDIIVLQKASGNQLETACNLLKCIVNCPRLALSVRLAWLPTSTWSKLIGAMMIPDTGLQVILGMVKFLLFLGGQKFEESFVNTGGVFYIYYLMSLVPTRFKDAGLQADKPNIAATAEACEILSTILNGKDRTMVASFKAMMDEGKGTPNLPSPLPNFAEEETKSEKAKAARLGFFQSMAGLLRAALEGHKELLAEECLCLEPCHCPPTRDAVIEQTCEIIGPLIMDDLGVNIRVAQQAGLVPLLLDVMEKSRVKFIRMALTLLNELAYVKGGGDRSTIHPDFVANYGAFRLARLAVHVRNNHVILEEDIGGYARAMASPLLIDCVRMVRKSVKVMEVTPDLRQSMSSTGVCDLIAEFLQQQVDVDNMEIVLAAMSCLGSCERMDDALSKTIEARAVAVMDCAVPYLKDHFGLLRDGAHVVDSAKRDQLTPLAAALRELVRVPQYKAAMQGDKDLEKLLEHLIGVAKRSPGRCSVPGCKCGTGPGNDQAIQDMTAVRRLIHARPEKANRPAPMDEAEKAEAEKAAERAFQELLEAEEKEKNEKENKAAKKNKKKQKGKAGNVQPAAHDAPDSKPLKMSNKIAEPVRAPSPASSVRSDASPRLAYDVAGASGGLRMLGFFAEEDVSVAVDAPKVADAVHNAPPQTPAKAPQASPGHENTPPVGGSEPQSPGEEWVVADRKRRPAAARNAAAQAEHPPGARHQPPAGHPGHASSKPVGSLGVDKPRPRPPDAAAFLRTAHRPAPPNFAAAVAAAAAAIAPPAPPNFAGAAAAAASAVAPPVGDAAPGLDGLWPRPADAFLRAAPRPAPPNFASAVAAAAPADEASLTAVVEPPVPAQASAPRAVAGDESPGPAPMGNPVLDVFAALTLQPRPPPTAADASDVSGPTTPLPPGPQRRGALQVELRDAAVPDDSPRQPVSPGPVTPREPWGRPPGPQPSTPSSAVPLTTTSPAAPITTTSSAAPPFPKMRPPGPQLPATSSAAPTVPKMTPPGPRPPSGAPPIIAVTPPGPCPPSGAPPSIAAPGPPLYRPPGPRPDGAAPRPAALGPSVPVTGASASTPVPPGPPTPVAGAPAPAPPPWGRVLPPRPPVVTAPGPRPGGAVSAAAPPGAPVTGMDAAVRPAWALSVEPAPPAPAPPPWATAPPVAEETPIPADASPLLAPARPRPRRLREQVQGDQAPLHPAVGSAVGQVPRPPGPPPWSQVGMTAPGPRIPAAPVRPSQIPPTPPGPRVHKQGDGPGIDTVVTASAPAAVAPAISALGTKICDPPGMQQVSAHQPRPPGPPVGGRPPPGFAGPLHPPVVRPPSDPVAVSQPARLDVMPADPDAALHSDAAGRSTDHAGAGASLQAPPSREGEGSVRPPPSLDALMPMFTCPLSKVVMQDPVLAVDGYSYERAAISEFLRTSAHRRSPMVPEVELTYRLLPNINLRGFMKETLGH